MHQKKDFEYSQKNPEVAKTASWHTPNRSDMERPKSGS